MARTRVLIVDDDVRLSFAVKTGLESAGSFEVRVENNPRQARFVAREFMPHVVVLDVIMPEKDGGVVASELRENPELRDVPIIFVTSIVSQKEVDTLGGRMGDEPVLAKPFTLADLIRQIRKSLGLPQQG